MFPFLVYQSAGAPITLACGVRGCLTNHIRVLYDSKNIKKAIFICSIQNNSLTLQRNQPTPWDYVFQGGHCRHSKGVISALCLAIRNLASFKLVFNTLQHFDVLGICISISIRTMRVCMCAYISAWASVLLVRILRAMREPRIAEQQQCSPAFFVYAINNKASINKRRQLKIR